MGGGQYSANFSIRQIIYYILGAIIALVIMLISPKKIRNNTYILYFIFCVLLIGLLILPETSITPIINGAKSWYSFGPSKYSTLRIYEGHLNSSISKERF